MTWLYFIAGTFGLGAAALSFTFWRFLKKAKRVDALEAENALLKKETHILRKTQGIFARPRGDKSSVIDEL